MKIGKFNEFGGQYVPEILMNCLKELEDAYNEAKEDKNFMENYHHILKEYCGRETPLYFAENISAKLSQKVYLKREDLNHTGAHKINNAIGQVLLAKRMGKKYVIAETGAGQHGVATATAAAKYKLGCKVFMGEEDIKRQYPNVQKMKLLGAEVVPVVSGSKTLKDAVNEAIKYWASNVDDAFYVIGSVVGPHPYPTIVRDFQRVIGDEARRQVLEKEKSLPNYIIAPVGGGSNSMGIFYPFIDDDVKLIGVEGGGYGVNTKFHSATMSKKEVGILHGMKTYILKDEDGEIQEAYSISAGLDYPGVGPEHAYLESIKRAEYVSVTDKEAMEALLYLTNEEGIIPAIESSHGIAYLIKLCKELNLKNDFNNIIIVNLSGRGDKDMETILDYIKGGESHE